MLSKTSSRFTSVVKKSFFATRFDSNKINLFRVSKVSKNSTVEKIEKVNPVEKEKVNPVETILKKLKPSETKMIESLATEEFEEPSPSEIKEKTIKTEEKITKEELQQSIMNFKSNPDPLSEDMYPVFRNIVTFKEWLIPTSDDSDSSVTEFKVDASVVEGRKVINIYSDPKNWEHEKIGKKLVNLENISCICENQEIEEIIIDINSESMFVIPREYFETLSQWETITFSEVIEKIKKLIFKLCLHFIRSISNIAKVFEQNEKEIPDNVKNTFLFEPLKFLKEKSELLIPIRTNEENEEETEIMMINKNNQVYLGLFTSPDIANNFCKKSGFNFEKTMRSLPIVRRKENN
jgi:hypothetical protein